MAFLWGKGGCDRLLGSVLWFETIRNKVFFSAKRVVAYILYGVVLSLSTKKHLTTSHV